MIRPGQDRAEWENPGPAELERIIGDSKVVAVVGLSSKESRPSNEVARYLDKQGFIIIPVNPKETEVLGKQSYPDLGSVDRRINIVNVFRKREDTPPIIREAIMAGVKYVWFQKGVISRESFELAGKAGIPIVMDKCLLEEHKRLKS